MDDKSRVFWSAFEEEFEKCASLGANLGYLLRQHKWPLLLGGGALAGTVGGVKGVGWLQANATMPQNRMAEKALKVGDP